MKLRSVLFCILLHQLNGVLSCYPFTSCVRPTGTWMRNTAQCKSVFVDESRKRVQCKFGSQQETLTCCASLKPGVVVERPPPEVLADLKCKEYSKATQTEDFVSLLAGATATKMNNCARDRTPLIVGGEEAQIGDLPHQVRLGYVELKTQNIKFMCGGSLLSCNYVLSAAHCCSPHPSFSDIKYIQGGGISEKTIESDGFTVEVEKVIPHPAYKREYLYHDIALVKMAVCVDLTPTVVPICLQCLPSATAWGSLLISKKGVISGFGKTQYGGVASDRLLKAVIQPVSFQYCADVYGKSAKIPNGLNSTTQLCAYAEGKDTCQGDSGGPLAVESPHHPCMYALVGCTSFGKGCGVKGYPGVYTNVCHYLPWIVDTVWPTG